MWTVWPREWPRIGNPTALATVSTVNLRNCKWWPLAQYSASWSRGSVSAHCLWGQRTHSIGEGTPMRLTVSVWVQEMWACEAEEELSCRVYTLRRQLWTNLWGSRTWRFTCPLCREQWGQPRHHQSSRLQGPVCTCGSWAEGGVQLLRSNPWAYVRHHHSSGSWH